MGVEQRMGQRCSVTVKLRLRSAAAASDRQTEAARGQSHTSSGKMKEHSRKGTKGDGYWRMSSVPVSGHGWGDTRRGKSTSKGLEVRDFTQSGCGEQQLVPLGSWAVDRTPRGSRSNSRKSLPHGTPCCLPQPFQRG